MTNIETLMAAEADLAAQTPELLNRYDPELMSALNDALGLYTTFCRAWGQAAGFSDYAQEYLDAGAALGLTSQASFKEALAQKPTTALLERLRLADRRLSAYGPRALVLLQMGRAFAWSLSDLMRSRLTAAIGHQRPIIEGYGLLCLMRDDPEAAERWQTVLTDDDGRKFFNASRDRVAEYVKAAGLEEMYQRASGMSQHLRFAGVVFGVQFDAPDDESILFSTRLVHQELRADTAAYFIAEVLNILRHQVRLFVNLPRAVPEMTDPVWLERVRDFVAAVERLYARYRSAFPTDAARLEANLGPLPMLNDSKRQARPDRVVKAVKSLTPSALRQLVRRIRASRGPGALR